VRQPPEHIGARHAQVPDSDTLHEPPVRFALVRFAGAETAALRFALACKRTGGVPCLREVGVVEHHRDGRLMLRGTFAGRYMHVDKHTVSESGAARRALSGGILGFLFGAPALAVGLPPGTAGAARVAAPSEAEPEPRSLGHRLREAIPRSSSALGLAGGATEVAEMLGGIEAGAAEIVEGVLDARLHPDLEQALASPTQVTRPDSGGAFGMRGPRRSREGATP
jgi:hypothetical protein